MRISDWSSDVCSSDLSLKVRIGGKRHCCLIAWKTMWQRTIRSASSRSSLTNSTWKLWALPAWCRRSEEHTSELQSLMSSSYDVFCVKKKNSTKTQQRKNTRHKRKKHDK